MQTRNICCIWFLCKLCRKFNLCRGCNGTWSVIAICCMLVRACERASSTVSNRHQRSCSASIVSLVDLSIRWILWHDKVDDLSTRSQGHQLLRLFVRFNASTETTGLCWGLGGVGGWGKGLISEVRMGHQYDCTLYNCLPDLPSQAKRGLHRCGGCGGNDWWG
jgi:hypothetical protein